MSDELKRKIMRTVIEIGGISGQWAQRSIAMNEVDGLIATIEEDLCALWQTTPEELLREED